MYPPTLHAGGIKMASAVCSAVQLRPHLVKVGDDLVEQPQTLDSLVIHLSLGVEVGEAGDGGEHDSDGVVGLRVQLLQGHRSKRGRHISRMMSSH